MASWTYHGWRGAGEPGSSARISALRSHIAEVALKLDAEVSTHGHSRSTTELNSYLERLEESERREVQSPRNRTNGGLSRVRFGRAL